MPVVRRHERLHAGRAVAARTIVDDDRVLPSLREEWSVETGGEIETGTSAERHNQSHGADGHSSEPGVATQADAPTRATAMGTSRDLAHMSTLRLNGDCL